VSVVTNLPKLWANMNMLLWKKHERFPLESAVHIELYIWICVISVLHRVHTSELLEWFLELSVLTLWVSKKMLWTGCGAGGQLNWCNSAKTFTATVLSGWFVQLLFHNLKSCSCRVEFCRCPELHLVLPNLLNNQSVPGAYWQLGCWAAVLQLSCWVLNFICPSVFFLHLFFCNGLEG